MVAIKFALLTVITLFFRMVCDLAYRTLDNVSIKEKRVNDVVFQLLGHAIKHYSHGLAFPVRAIDILSTQEMAVVPIANGILVLNDELNIKTSFGVILKELVESLTAANTAELVLAKNASLFLITVSELSPKLVIPHLSNMAQDMQSLEVKIIIKQ